MTLPTDATLLAALETQHRRLTELLQRLEFARATLVPPPATFWIGAARLAYDSGIDAMAGTVDGAVLVNQFELGGVGYTGAVVRAGG